MRNSTTHGADYVVLTMFFGIIFAFGIAVVNWICDRLFGFRFLSRLAQEVTFVMVPPLFLIFLVLGTIFIGVATPTEGGAMGAAGAIILAIIKGRLTLDLIRQAAESTAKLSAFVVFILIGARVFSLTFYGVDGHRWVENLLVSLPGGQIGFLIFVNIFVFLLAFFLDFFELAFIVIPLLGPAAEKLGIDLIWFGVMLGVNMQTSFMHPPFGFALFYLRSVAPRDAYVDRVTGKRMEPVTTGQIYWGAVPFVIIQCIAVALVISFPQWSCTTREPPNVDPGNIEIRHPAAGRAAAARLQRASGEEVAALFSFFQKSELAAEPFCCRRLYQDRHQNCDEGDRRDHLSSGRLHAEQQAGERGRNDAGLAGPAHEQHLVEAPPRTPVRQRAAKTVTGRATSMKMAITTMPPSRY